VLNKSVKRLPKRSSHRLYLFYYYFRRFFGSNPSLDLLNQVFTTRILYILRRVPSLTRFIKALIETNDRGTVTDAVILFTLKVRDYINRPRYNIVEIKIENNGNKKKGEKKTIKAGFRAGKVALVGETFIKKGR